MTATWNRSSVLRAAAMIVGLTLASGVVAACSSDDAASGPVGAIDAASSAAAAAASADAAGAGVAGTADMRALCDQMVSGGMTPDEATSLAEQNGYTARVGTLEGAPQAVTMDYREDRFTFDVEGGVVVSCTYG
ncbi:MAG: hypothetical protein GC156_12275 [Actinomycetales bacterium]|nr:hypothetical protein [Actinomycetales bacterium]